MNIQDKFKEYLSEKIMDKKSPLYYGDIIEIVENFNPNQGQSLPIDNVSVSFKCNEEMQYRSVCKEQCDWCQQEFDKWT